MTDLTTVQTQTAFMVIHNTQVFSRDLLALVMGVPDEDKVAFDKMLDHWLCSEAQDEEWGFDPYATPLPSDALEGFWQHYGFGVPYRGSPLEGEVLAYRGQIARTLEEVRRVLLRMGAHIDAKPALAAKDVRGFYSCIEEGLGHPDFEGKPDKPLLRVA